MARRGVVGLGAVRQGRRGEAGKESVIQILAVVSITDIQKETAIKVIVMKSPATTVVISPINMQMAAFTIVGTAPLVQHKFSAKARAGIKDTQAAGTPGRNKKKREPKDFKQIYKDCMHISEDGWIGIPAPAFRSALISACRVAGFQMTRAKMSVFVEADGYDADEGTPLVRITKGEPREHESYARNETGVVDIRVRPMWREWQCVLRVKWDADQFTLTDISNLLVRAGVQSGVGEGRPDSKKSHGMGWGTFKIGNPVKNAA